MTEDKLHAMCWSSVISTADMVCGPKATMGQGLQLLEREG